MLKNLSFLHRLKLPILASDTWLITGFSALGNGFDKEEALSKYVCTLLLF